MMVILAIVAALIVPSLRAFGVGRNNSNTATLIVGLAHYARTQAVTEGRTYRLNFDPAGNAVWLTLEDGGVFQSPSSDYGQRFNLPEGEQLRTDAAAHPDGQYVEFHATGRTDPAHVWLTDKLGDKIEVACASATELYRILPAAEMTQ